MELKGSPGSHSEMSYLSRPSPMIPLFLSPRARFLILPRWSPSASSCNSERMLATSSIVEPSYFQESQQKHHEHLSCDESWEPALLDEQPPMARRPSRAPA